MNNNQQPHLYKGTNNQPIIKQHCKCRNEKGSKNQINPKKMAVRKENPTEQGLKLYCSDVGVKFSKGPKRKSNRTRIETQHRQR